MTIVYSILLLLLSYSSTVLAKNCGDPVKCCDSDKSLECVYKTPVEQTADPKCNCAPKDKFSTKLRTYECTWEARPEGTTDYGKFIPCYGFYESCQATQLQGEPPPRCQIGYPPLPSSLQLSKEHNCNFDGSKVDIYNVFYTCWLYPCRNRFEKPPEIKSTEWCYPPTIMDGSLAKKILADDGKNTFCERYTVDNSVEYYDVAKKGTSFCLLPPLCKSGTNTTDTDKFMPTNYMKKGASNMDHCEQLCDRNGDNNGDFINGKATCRVIPSCDAGNTTSTYNKFQVPECLPWCTDEDSRVRSSSRDKRKDVKDCNPKPVCEEEGKAPQPLYGQLNPYAALDCIPKRNCAGQETSKTHFCDDIPATSASEGEEDDSGGMSMATIIGLSVAGLILLLIIAGLVGLVWYRTLKKRREDDAEWERQQRPRDPTAMKKSSNTRSKDSSGKPGESVKAGAIAGTPAKPGESVKAAGSAKPAKKKEVDNERVRCKKELAMAPVILAHLLNEENQAIAMRVRALNKQKAEMEKQKVEQTQLSPNSSKRERKADDMATGIQEEGSSRKR